MLFFKKKPALEQTDSSSAISSGPSASKEKFDEDREVAVVDEKSASSFVVDEIDDKPIEKAEDVAVAVCLLHFLFTSRWYSS